MSLVADLLGLDYHHSSGEVHIMENNQWVSCPGKHSIPHTKKTRRGASKLLAIVLLIVLYITGQDNPSEMCSVGDVPDIILGDVIDHIGPFDGVVMGEGCLIP